MKCFVLVYCIPGNVPSYRVFFDWFAADSWGRQWEKDEGYDTWSIHTAEVERE